MSGLANTTRLNVVARPAAGADGRERLVETSAPAAAPAAPHALPSWSWATVALAGIGGWSIEAAIGYGIYRLF